MMTNDEKIDRMILLDDLRAKIAWVDFDSLNLQNLKPLRLEVKKEMTELIKPMKKGEGDCDDENRNG